MPLEGTEVPREQWRRLWKQPDRQPLTASGLTPRRRAQPGKRGGCVPRSQLALLAVRTPLRLASAAEWRLVVTLQLLGGLRWSWQPPPEIPPIWVQSWRGEMCHTQLQELL